MDNPIITELKDKVDTKVLIDRPLVKWRSILLEECQVYVFGQSYLAKRFDSIHYEVCDKEEAKEILIDNLYSLLRFKYFTSPSEEGDKRIREIISNFTDNLKTTLKRVSIDVYDEEYTSIQMLPNHCIAFRNGVYDFKNNKWLFKYNIVKLHQLSNTMYLYDNKYMITWYFNYNFEPWPIDVMNDDLEDVIKMMKDLTKENRNYCFELMYNISHDKDHRFDLSRFIHLCEIMSYLCHQSLVQYFELLVGKGQNGKNSLFDGCFTSKVVPAPAANNLNDIERDRFITGSLENKSQNIFLEASTTEEVYEESKMIKALTGSMYQTIEKKGINKYSGYINCRFLFSANDQDKIKFSDTTIGFIRRINVFEIYYQWDEYKRFMKKAKDYYDTTFSQDFHEITDDISNSIMFIYFAMYGLKAATNNFTKEFAFTKNDWKKNYSNLDWTLKDSIEEITLSHILHYIKSSPLHYAECKALFYDDTQERLYISNTLKDLGYKGYDEMIKMLDDDEVASAYFSENDVYMSIKTLQNICGNTDRPTLFTQNLKKLYNINDTPLLYCNRPYVKVSLAEGRIKIITGK